MIVCEPRRNERIPVTWEELEEINYVVDQSAGKWTKPAYIAQLFNAARAGSGAKVYLRSEGWHQMERYEGGLYKHITLHYLGWTYHLYTKLRGNMDEIGGDTHKIDYISYQAGRNRFVNLEPTS